MTSARWRAHAACRGLNPVLFYDPHPASVAAAKQCCRTCPVRVDCAADAVAAGEEFGVWGGLTEDERPTVTPPERPAPGPVAQISDDDLYDIFDRADPDRAALEHLLEHHYIPTATAYKYLARAERLGVVEHRGRGLFPARR
jgi:hypothetical protein